ncbi:proenkephalin b [Chanos chanos]|uniref:Proenkephalin b n=1 Tax=Chanos chanos TaxID=29144 RepID=A0A6J2VU35_CHACN|nr:proenkephalin-A [Chanos chanos]
MAVPVITFWLVILSACLALTVSADCGADCAYCSVHLRLQRTDLNSVACVLECEGPVNSGTSWSLCQDLLQTTIGINQGDQISTETSQPETEQHSLEKKYGGFMKKYGGFMKRYGGFMKRYGGFMKKTAELYGLEPDDVDHGREILNSHDLEVLSNQIAEDAMKEAGDAEDKEGGAATKRYGGFMRRGGAYGSEGVVRALQKRYGGFMRRVGRPEWGQESKRYGGFLKRSSPGEDEEDEEESSEVDKRYGGFMDY